MARWLIVSGKNPSIKTSVIIDTRGVGDHTHKWKITKKNKTKQTNTKQTNKTKQNKIKQTKQNKNKKPESSI